MRALSSFYERPPTASRASQTCHIHSSAVTREFRICMEVSPLESGLIVHPIEISPTGPSWRLCLMHGLVYFAWSSLVCFCIFFFASHLPFPLLPFFSSASTITFLSHQHSIYQTVWKRFLTSASVVMFSSEAVLCSHTQNTCLTPVQLTVANIHQLHNKIKLLQVYCTNVFNDIRNKAKLSNYRSIFVSSSVICKGLGVDPFWMPPGCFPREVFLAHPARRRLRGRADSMERLYLHTGPGSPWDPPVIAGGSVGFPAGAAALVT